MSLELQALSAFAVATIVSFALTPLAAKLAFRVGAVAQVSDRSLHDHDMPSLGGLAILSGLLVASLIFLPDSTETEGIIAGALVIAFVGTLDDIFDLPPLAEADRSVLRRSDPGVLGRGRDQLHAAVHRPGGPRRRGQSR